MVLAATCQFGNDDGDGAPGVGVGDALQRGEERLEEHAERRCDEEQGRDPPVLQPEGIDHVEVPLAFEVRALFGVDVDMDGDDVVPRRSSRSGSRYG